MTKRLNHDLTYDAPLDRVAAMLADPAFREEVLVAQRVLRSEVGITGDPAGDGGMDVTLDQVQAAAGIPSFAKRLVGDEIHIIQTEHWTSSAEADLRLTIPGKPGEMSGTVRVVETGGVTTETVRLDIKVGIPLVGGKIEGLVSDLLLKALKVENRVGRDYLSR